MKDLSDRIFDALRREEAESEKFASLVRLIIIIILTIIALFNVRTVSLAANLLNFGTLGIAFGYSLVVYLVVHRVRYYPSMKYITSCIDVTLVMLVLYLYTSIDLPAVVLKNYVFYIVFLMIALTAFRYDPWLTAIVGSLAVVQYLGLFLWLTASELVTITYGSYELEFYSAEVTYAGQITKIAILCGFIVLIIFLARYSRKLMVKLVHDELNVISQKDQMDAELAIASAVQTKLLPHSFPQIDRMEIYGVVLEGKSVGGDYCDFFVLSDDRLLLVQADVCGSGIPAALTMAQVHASMHLLASMNIELEPLTRQLNQMLYQSTERNNFVSFFIAEINTSLQVLTYVNAGHPPPIVYSNEQFSSLSERTLPLGVQSSNQQLVKHQVPFHPGDLLVAYTDGLLEQTSSEGEEYGEERLRDFTAGHSEEEIHQFVSLLLDHVRTFGSSTVLKDDVSIAVARFI